MDGFATYLNDAAGDFTALLPPAGIAATHRELIRCFRRAASDFNPATFKQENGLTPRTIALCNQVADRLDAAGVDGSPVRLGS